jgi:putative chitinase
VNAVSIAIAFWTEHGLNAFADRDDIKSLTERINGGLNGLATRQTYLVRAMRLLTPPVPPATAVA